MYEQWYELREDENVILEETQVKYDSASFSNIALLTNQRIVFIKLGLLKRLKGIGTIELEDIISSSVELNDDKNLIIQYNLGTAKVTFNDTDDRFRNVLIWNMALEDLRAENSALFDRKYYQRFIDDDFPSLTEENKDSSQEAMAFVSDVAKSVIKSKRLTAGSLAWGVGKTAAKRAMNDSGKEAIGKLKKEIGYYELRNEFDQLKNDFRSELGLNPKMTRQELEDQAFIEDFNRKKEYARHELRGSKPNSIPTDTSMEENNQKSPMNVNEQIDVLKRLKELLDAGILTQEEFNAKKKEILNI